MRKRIVLITVFICVAATIYLYLKDDRKKNINVKIQSEIYELYRVNNCGMEKKEYLCRLDFRSSNRLISVGLKERYINFLKNKKVRIDTYFELNTECLKTISYESFKEEISYCIPVFSQKI